MPAFATAAWFEVLAARLAALAPEVEPPFAVELAISDAGPGERARWQVVLGGGRAVLVAEPDRAATLTMRCDRATAIELGAGRLNAQQAIAAGRLQVSGDLARTAALGEVLSHLGASRSASGDMPARAASENASVESGG
jgi:putative sterol carrier protein